jgi:uncharacterized protein YraI
MHVGAGLPDRAARGDRTRTEVTMTAGRTFPRWAAALALGLPLMAGAENATTMKDVHLRAGPARDYPVVAVLPAGVEVVVEGCLPSYTWCDVTTGELHGWVWAGNLSAFYEGTPVPILRYGPRIGIVVRPFVLIDYWSLYYPSRPWYHDRDRWLHRPPPHPRPPPGPHPPPGPPKPPPPHPAPPPIHPKPPPHQPGPIHPPRPLPPQVPHGPASGPVGGGAPRP